MREIKASEFKAKCLKLIDEVNQTGESIVVTKRGKVVARLDAAYPKPANPFGRGRGLIETVNAKDDLIDILSADETAQWHRGDPLIDAKLKPQKPKSQRKKTG